MKKRALGFWCAVFLSPAFAGAVSCDFEAEGQMTSATVETRETNNTTYCRIKVKDLKYVENANCPLVDAEILQLGIEYPIFSGHDCSAPTVGETVSGIVSLQPDGKLWLNVPPPQQK